MSLEAVIIAGGRGTRMGALAEALPKALLPVAGRPLLDYTLSLLQKYSVTSVVICIGHLGEKIERHVGDGSTWGLQVRYSRESKPLGTAGCLRAISPAPSEDFLVLYADLLIEMDLRALLQAHQASHTDATLVVHPNDHPFDSDLVALDYPTTKILEIHKKPHAQGMYFPNLVSAAVYVLNPRLLDLLVPGEKADCAHDLFPRALEADYHLGAYRTPAYIKDVGTPGRLAEAEADLQSGRVVGSNRGHRRPAVFLDRDGVINREVDLLRRADQLELLPGAAAALRRLNRSGWLTVVVTNQPVVARGLCNEPAVRQIHAKLEWLLGREGAFVDAIYYCPHHPDRGFPGENPAYKISCNCRKPAIGLVENAARDFNIDLRASWFIGDTTTDLQTGKNASMKTVLVRTGYAGHDLKFSDAADHVGTDLAGAVDWILAQKNSMSPLLVAQSIH
jgi:mannose-1-phosphate guanylyltransferase/phosphomannomutase